jgi:hypothetical protein
LKETFNHVNEPLFTKVSWSLQNRELLLSQYLK